MLEIHFNCDLTELPECFVTIYTSMASKGYNDFNQAGWSTRCNEKKQKKKKKPPSVQIL